MVIYCAKNRVNGKTYVGQSRHGIATRKQAHQKLADNGSPFPFHRALRKYGCDAFEWSVLETADTLAGLDEAEARWIRALDSMAHRRGYNRTLGGAGANGMSYSAETRAKISRSLTGRKVAPEAVEKSRQWLLGHKQSAETRAKRSASLRGHVVTAETREKIRATLRGEA